MAKKKSKDNKIRTEFRKKHDARRRKNDFTREFLDQHRGLEEMSTSERVSGKGGLTRKKTVLGVESNVHGDGFQVDLQVHQATHISGRVIRVHGLNSIVATDDGRQFECALRGILKSLATDLQHVVVAGDRVMLQVVDQNQAVIVRVEPRTNQLSRTSRQRQQIMVSNIDQVLIVASAAEPRLKPNLVDRFIVSAEKAKIRPVIIINKIDLVSLADLQPVVGVWGRMGYPLLLTSAKNRINTERLKQIVLGRASVVAGQSGVGKSSILNAIQDGLDLRVAQVSALNSKGRHTTTTAALIPLEGGGHLIDTPGIRQFQLWDVIPPEVASYFRDLRPFVNGCRFPDCTHTHEDDCQVKYAVADGRIDVRRYESYCQICQ